MISVLRNCPPNLLVGAFLVIINFPLGWIGLAWFVNLAKKTGNMFFYCLGVCFYALSWGVLFFGIFLCGKDYAQAVYLKYHMPILIVTIMTIAAIIVFYTKKPQKSIKIRMIDKESQKI